MVNMDIRKVSFDLLVLKQLLIHGS